MLLLKTLSTLLALSSSAIAFPFSSSSDESEDVTFKSSIFEKLARPPNGWERDDSLRIDKDGSSVKLRIHLVQTNMREFHDLALKVFDFRILEWIERFGPGKGLCFGWGLRGCT